MSVSKMLKGQELFESFSFEEIDKIDNFSEIKEFRKGENIYISGKTGVHFFILLGGRVNIRLSADAHEASLIVGRVEKGDMFGLSPLLGAGRHTATAQCVKPSKVLAIKAKPFRVLLEQNSFVGLQVMGVAAKAYFSRYVEALKRFQKVVNDIAAI
jgi:CRP-like cAMP-binding protein